MLCSLKSQNATRSLNIEPLPAPDTRGKKKEALKMLKGFMKQVYFIKSNWLCATSVKTYKTQTDVNPTSTFHRQNKKHQESLKASRRQMWAISQDIGQRPSSFGGCFACASPAVIKGGGFQYGGGRHPDRWGSINVPWARVNERKWVRLSGKLCVSAPTLKPSSAIYRHIPSPSLSLSPHHTRR